MIITCAIKHTLEIYNELVKKYPAIPAYHLCAPFKVESCFLPESELKKHKAELLDSYKLLQDKESQDIFCDTLNRKLTGNMLPLNRYPLGYEAYSFFDEAFIHTDDESIYVDVGAYTGDTIACFLMFSYLKI